MTDPALARAIAAATSLTAPCTHRRTDMKLEDRPDTGVVHDRLEDCSSRRRVTGVEAEVCDLLELEPGQRPWLRLSDAWWRRVDALVARIEQPAVPSPRAAADGQVTA